MIDKPIKDLTPEEREQVIQELKETATPEELESLTELSKWIGDAQAWLRLAFYNSAFYKNMDSEIAQSFLTALREFLPALIDELKNDEAASKMTPTELVNSDKYDEIVKRAADRVGVKETENLPHIKYNKGTELKTSTDKLTAPKSKASGQREMLPIPREEMIPLKYESDRKNAAPITLFYDFFYNDNQLKRLGIDGGFDSYDFFITAVFDNLLLEGNETVSLSKVWRELGNTGSPNTTQLTELYKRAVRGATTTITIDDSEVQEAWGNNPNDKYTEIISPVMPLQIRGEKFIANGNVAKAEIKILSLSPFFALSQSIGHFTTWKKEILQLYTGRKTSRYYTVLHYLMAQIAWLRNPHSTRSNKITYKELYEYNNDKSTRAKQLTRDMAYRLLDEVFIPSGYILSYKEDSKGEAGISLKYSKSGAARLNDKKR